MRSFIPARKSRLSRTPLSTFTSKKRSQSASGLLKWVRFEDAEVVHEHLDRGEAMGEFFRRRRGRKIAGE